MRICNACLNVSTELGKPTKTEEIDPSKVEADIILTQPTNQHIQTQTPPHFFLSLPYFLTFYHNPIQIFLLHFLFCSCFTSKRRNCKFQFPHKPFFLRPLLIFPNLTDLNSDMKLLPSPSCSSSSSFSTSTFDAHACNPRAAATPGCLAGILRRILCSGSLPTHPSDQIAEEPNSVKSDDKLLQVKVDASVEPTSDAKPTAGIVARLMGLDPMPEMKLNQKLISRSQSMNSLEHFCQHLEGKHRRVRSTLSFREIPTFLELENEDYFILSFEGESGSKEFRAKPRRSGRRCEEFKQRKEEEEDRNKNTGSNKTEQLSERKTKKKRFDPEEAKEYVLIDLKEKKKSRKRISDKHTQKVGNNGRVKISTKERHRKPKVGGSVAERVTNGRKLDRKVESESSSDESSPVSVLDCSQFLRDPEAPLSGDASSSPIHPRRKLSPELETFQSPSPRNDDDLIINEGKLPKTKGGGDGAQQDKWEEEICRITETELAESHWEFSKICQEHENLEGILAGFDSNLLEGLIDEFVEQMYDLDLKITNM